MPPACPSLSSPASSTFATPPQCARGAVRCGLYRGQSPPWIPGRFACRSGALFGTGQPAPIADSGAFLVGFAGRTRAVVLPHPGPGVRGHLAARSAGSRLRPCSAPPTVFPTWPRNCSFCSRARMSARRTTSTLARSYRSYQAKHGTDSRIFSPRTTLGSTSCGSSRSVRPAPEPSTSQR